MSTIREKDIEQYLHKQAIALGGMTYKWSSPSRRGVPDRIVISPSGNVAFVEVKSPTGVLSKLQKIMVYQLRSFYCNVFVVNSKESVDETLEKIWRCE